MDKRIQIVDFLPQYKEHFVRLNTEWLDKYFYVEPHDMDVFEHPENIIENGGEIFFAKIYDKIVGTVSLIKEKEEYELSKMCVTEDFKGYGIGNLLMQHCLSYAKNKGYKKIYLISNRKLLPAIELYKKFGFIEVPLSQDNPYVRGDIKMEKIL